MFLLQHSPQEENHCNFRKRIQNCNDTGGFVGGKKMKNDNQNFKRKSTPTECVQSCKYVLQRPHSLVDEAVHCMFSFTLFVAC
jgi:hypothetical protein